MSHEAGHVETLIKAAITWWDVFVTACVSLFFGTVQYMQRYASPGEPPPFRWMEYLAKGIASVAAGGLTMLLARRLDLDPEWSWIMISFAGYAGAELLNAGKDAALNALADWVKRKASKDA